MEIFRRKVFRENFFREFEMAIKFNDSTNFLDPAWFYVIPELDT